MVRKGWMFLLVAIVFFSILIGYIVTSPERDNKPKIVVVLRTLNLEYWQMVRSGAEQAFHDFNIDGKVIAPNSELQVKEQITILKNALEENPDALIVAPNQPPAVIPVLKEYKTNNIPVMIVDTETDWNGQTAFIGTDPYTLGRKSGELLASMLQPGDQVALIGETLFTSRESVRMRSAREALQNAGVEIITEQVVDTERGKIRSVMGNVLKKFPDIKGVFAANDEIALYSLEEIKEKGFQIPVVGTDGISDIMEDIEEGSLDATVAQNPYDMGYLSVERALKAIKGEPGQKRIDSGVDLITQDNAKQRLDFMKDIRINAVSRKANGSYWWEE
ncbi:sugar ABC transporter substrate-binding protein [Ectobacillus funiculus]|uniref:Sugar ABC transporter substrate-binding protein n=1 Tax=Ectobacillus funiculus TaxID=137993 RepID=A0ABV5WIG1_9BACI